MFTLQEILKITNGTLQGATKSSGITGVCTDSRKLQAGDLFIAIKGESFDGHHFVNEVIRKSASAVIVSNYYGISNNKKVPIIRVRDTVKALGQIARFHRDRFSIPVIAITGSTGKTTTKEMIAAVLETRYNVLKNIATENNHIGVPQTLLRLNARHDVAVVELGTNHFGEIRYLTEIAHPTMAILTNIGESHLEFFKTSRGVFREKFDLVKYMSRPGTVLFNVDDRHLSKITRRTARHRLIQFGIKNASTYRADRIRMKEDCGLTFRVNKKEIFKLKTITTHNAYNALAAIGCGHILGIGFQGASRALSRFNFPKGRQTFERIGSYWIIDDTYNANPVSFKSAMETLKSLNVPGRKILVCGDMFELGSQSEKLHRLAGEFVVDAKVNFVMTVGKKSKLISERFKKNGNRLYTRHFASLEPACHSLKDYLRKGDAILVKGSRGMHMEKMVEFLRKKG